MKAKPWFRTSSVLIMSWVVFLQQSFHGDAAHLRDSLFRDLQEIPTQISSIPLFLTLSYVNNAIADSLESRVPDDEVVAILCEAVYSQVRRVDLECQRR